jgi:O-methyltransferase
MMISEKFVIPHYIELLKKSLLNELYLGVEVAYFHARDCLEGKADFDERVVLDPAKFAPDMFAEAVRARHDGQHIGKAIRNIGFSHTMIGRQRMDQLDVCVQSVIDECVPGDLMECGVWRGGAAILMRGILMARGITDRRVWVADSFEGLPKPRLDQDANLDLSKESYPQLAVSLEQVMMNFKRYDLLDEQVHFLKGWFKDTLSSAPIDRLALLRLDGDLYESTMDCLVALYTKVSPGGYVVIDDYGCLKCCADAVDDFRAANRIDEPLVKIDWTGVVWRKKE